MSCVNCHSLDYTKLSLSSHIALVLLLLLLLLVFLFCLLAELLFSLWQVEISEDEAEDRLQDAIQEKFAVFGDVC